MDVATPVSTTEEISKENCVLGAEKAAVSREGDDAIVNVSKEITFLETYIQNIGKNFNKNHTVEIMKFTSNIKDCFNKTLIDKIELSNTIISLQNTIKEKDSVIINLQREMIGKQNHQVVQSKLFQKFVLIVRPKVMQVWLKSQP